MSPLSLLALVAGCHADVDVPALEVEMLDVGEASNLYFESDDALLANVHSGSGSIRGDLSRIDLQTGEIEVLASPIVEFSPIGENGDLIVVDPEGRVYVLRADGTTEDRFVDPRAAMVLASADGITAYTQVGYSDLVIDRSGEAAFVFEVPDITLDGYPLAMAPDGRTFLAEDADEVALYRVIDTTTGEIASSTRSPDGSFPFDAVAHPDGTYRAGLSPDVDRIVLWEVGGDVQLDLEREGWPDNAEALLPGGDAVLAMEGRDCRTCTENDRMLVRYDVGSDRGEILGAGTFAADLIADVAASPGGRRLARELQDGILVVTAP